MKKRRTLINKHKGFTLLEVLIALSIMAISSLAILGQTGQSLTQLQQLQLKTTAILVAENQLNAIQIMPKWPALGTSNQTLNFADHEWMVSTDVTTTTDPWFRKIVVRVSIDNQQQPLSELTGYRGLH